MTDTPTAAHGALTPRQIALRDNEADTDNGRAERRQARLRAAEIELSNQQAIIFDLTRSRDFQYTEGNGVSPGVTAWVVKGIERQIATLEARCAEQQALIDALRAAR